MRPLRIISVLFLITLAISACNFPTQRETTSPDAVATEVAKMLTSSPEPTLASTPVVTLVIPTTPSQTTEVPTDTPVATETPSLEPTQTASPTQGVSTTQAPNTTPVIEDPRTTLGTPTNKDPFDNAQNWGIFADEHMKVEHEDSVLVLTALNPDGWHGWTMSGLNLADFYLEATFQPGTCDGKDSYGVMVRAPDFNKGYFYGFSCDGRFIFKKWDGSNFTTLLNWTANTAIKSGTGEVNRLGLMAKGDNFTFYANGVKLGSASDSTYQSGSVGLWIAAYATANFTTKVDELDDWVLH